MKSATLEEVSTVVSKGTTPTTLGHAFLSKGVPFLRAEDVTGASVDPSAVAFRISEETNRVLSRSQLQPGDLLITIAGTLGRVGYVPRCAPPMNCNQAVAFIRLRPDVIDLNYACLACQAKIGHLLKLQKIGTIGNLNLEQVRGFSIPLPSLEEQKSLAARLEKANRLRRTRRYVQEVSDSFLASVFLKMFGGEEAQTWSLETIESLGIEGKNAIRTGPFGSQLLHSEFTDGGVAVLGIDNAVQNRFAWDQRRYISYEKYEELKRYTVYPGDVLITIMATCGRCAVVPDNIPLAINTKHLCCITLNQRKCLPIYLQFCFLTHPQALKQLGVSERGAVMPGLNMTIIKELAIPVPPLSLQQKFVAIALKTQKLTVQQREADREAEHLFQTLLHRAFAENA